MRAEHYRQKKKCEACGVEFQASRAHARSCSPTCKKRLQRGSKCRRTHLAGGRSRLDQLAGNVPFVAAGDKGTKSPSWIFETFTQGLEVYWSRPGEAIPRPCKVNWNCEVGDICKYWISQGLERVPVEDLTSTFCANWENLAW
jgi:hypothetical protein